MLLQTCSVILCLQGFKFPSMLVTLVVSAVLGLVAGQTSQVAFSAGLTHDQTILNEEKILFDKVITNVGNGYDPTAGISTCPVDGIYAFQFHSVAKNDKLTWLELKRNFRYIASIYGHTSNGSASRSNSVVLELEKGDGVYVKAKEIGLHTISGHPYGIYTTFSGFRISAV